MTMFLGYFFILFQVVAADNGDDFANNLFTDLSPLLALFGERVTTQFMSQSIGFADCIVLAMAPLGIVTIIVSAIRVGGPPLMKAIIGRARENLSAAEIELMSSTSKEVCELWNGQTIVRCPGSGNVLEFVCLLPEGGRPPEYTIQAKPLQGATELTSPSHKPNFWNLKPLWKSLTSSFGSGMEAVQLDRSRTDDVDTETRPRVWLPWAWFSKKKESMDEEYGTELGEIQSGQEGPADSPPRGNSSGDEPPTDDHSSHSQPFETETEKDTVPKITIIRDREADAPCISLNRHAQLERREVHAVAVFGTLLQLSVLTYFSLITYRWPLKFKKEDAAVDSYAFPLAAIGTVLLVMGILLCGHVVESSTDEKY